MPRFTGEPAPAWEGECALDTHDVVETDRCCAVRKENKQERSRHTQAGSLNFTFWGLWLSRASYAALSWAWGGNTGLKPNTLRTHLFFGKG